MKKPLRNLKFILSLILCVTSMTGLVMPALASGEGEAKQLTGSEQAQQQETTQEQQETTHEQQETTQEQQNAQAQQQNAEAQQQNAQEQQQNTQQQNAQQQQNTLEQQTTSNEQQNGQEAGQYKKAAVTEGKNNEAQEGQQAENPEDPDKANIGGIYYELDKTNLTAVVYGGDPAMIGETLVIPASVKSPLSGNTYQVTAVKDNAFYNHDGSFSNIKKLVIENGVKTIGSICFYGLKVTDALVIPDSVSYIGKWSFGMGAFEKLVTGNGLVNMDQYVFSYGQFKEVEIAHDTKLLGYYTFYANKAKIETITFKGVRDVNRHVGDDTVTELYPTAFQGVQIGDVYLPDAAGEETAKKNVMTYLGRVNTKADFFHWRGTTYHVEDGALYEVQGNTLKLIDTIMDYNDRDLTIPAQITIQGTAYAVTEIGPAAFARNAASSDKSPMTFTLDYNENLTIAKDAFAGLRIEKIVIKGEEGSMDAQFAGLTGIEQEQLDYTIKKEDGDDEDDVDVGEAEVYNAAWLQKQIDDGKEVIALPKLPEGEAIILEAPVVIGKGKKVTLVSNGKNVTVRGTDNIGDYAFYVKDGGSLTLQDAGIKLTAPHGVVSVENGAQLQLDAGTIDGGTIDKAANGAVRVYGASMTITGGEITGTTVTTTESAAVFVSGGGSLVMNGGRIHKNETTIEMQATAGGVLLYGENASFTMNGGKITDNSSANGGGVVLMHKCTFNLNGGQIAFNTARGWGTEYASGFGGGVYVYGNAGGKNTEEYKISAESRFNMNGGEISNNSARHGGGIFVDSSYVTLNAGSIVNNDAKYQGGGVYVSHEYRTMRVNNALITGNTAEKYYAITGQDNTGMGGGLWACPTGAAVLHARNGVAIFDNTAESAGDDVVSVNLEGFDIQTRLNSRITGGGSVEYYWDGRVTSGVPGVDPTGHIVRTTPARYTPENIVVPFDPQNPQDEEYKSFAAKAFVSDADKANARANASLVIRGNTAQRGGGIATNGNVIFGAQGGISLEAKKTVNGETPAEQDVFTFELVDEAGNVVQSKQNKGEKIVFDDLIFKGEGTYTYSVREVKGTHPLITYDETVYQVIFTVTDQGGESLSTSVQYKKNGTAHTGALLFDNIKKDPEPKTLLPEAKKTLNGVAPGNNVFTFTLEKDGKVIDTAVNTEGGTVSFKGLTYTVQDIGTHVYTLTETAGNAEGVTYDKAVYTLQVEVKLNEDASALLVNSTWLKDGQPYTQAVPVFENKKEDYKPVITPARVQLRAEKRLNGGNPGTRSFRFELRDGAGNLIQSAYNNGSAITFRELTFDKEGTYTYTVRESAGSEQGVTYDGSVYTATVTVTATTSAKGDVTYAASVQWSSGGNPVFNNSYNPPEEPPVPNEPPEVLGVRRTDGGDVLGARRAKTGDMSRATNVVSLAAALTALAVLIAGKRKGKGDGDAE